MRDEGVWLGTIEPPQGRRGGVVRLVLIADGVEEATRVVLDGPGVTVRRGAGMTRGRLELLVSIASDAAPGRRDIEVVLGDQLRRLPRAFEILEQISSGGAGRGIGSHLI